MAYVIICCSILGGDRGGGGDRANNSNLMPAGEMEVQQFPDTIFVQGLADDVSEESLAQHFGAIGKLKVLNLISIRLSSNLTIIKSNYGAYIFQSVVHLNVQ